MAAPLEELPPDAKDNTGRTLADLHATEQPPEAHSMVGKVIRVSSAYWGAEFGRASYGKTFDLRVVGFTPQAKWKTFVDGTDVNIWWFYDHTPENPAQYPRI
jgi:hypothetical protein